MPPADLGLPTPWRLALDRHTRLASDGRVILGGTPWRIGRLAESTRDIAQALAGAAAEGIVMTEPSDLKVARALVDRGFAHPVPSVRDSLDCTIVVPVLDNAPGLERLLGGLSQPVIVVDDGSEDPAAILAVAERHGATVLRHQRNLGPGAARNTGLRAATSELVAFVDSDCQAPSDWLDQLVGHFDDPAVAVVAPRVVSASRSRRTLARYERTRSSLDMGDEPRLVRPGGRLSFVPSAAIAVRRAAIAEVHGFDEALRLGEDVDLCWRLAAAGWLVRYEPRAVVRHQTRARPIPWARRRFEYGTSAVDLAARHGRAIAPARVSAWNLTALGLGSIGRPIAAAGTLSAAALLLRDRLDTLPGAGAIAARVVTQGAVADAAAVGHLLRREWWPLGALALAAAPRSRLARTAAVCMLAPIVWELLAAPPQVGPARYVALRLADDAAYGTGVIVTSVRRRAFAPLLPGVSWPTTPRRPPGARVPRLRRVLGSRTRAT